MLDVFESPPASLAQDKNIHCNYVLIDGSKHEAVERWLYELVEAPDYRNLFDGTEWASIREVAPLLVRADRSSPLLERLVQEGRTLEWGYGISSEEAIDSIANHLRRFIMVRHPLGYNVMLRFADPTVARVLLAPSGDGGLPQFWMPFTAVTLPDALWDGWHLQENPESWAAGTVGLCEEGAVPPCLSELTLRGLTNADLRITLVKMMQHLETYFPDRAETKARRGVVTDLHSLMEQAIANGYESVQALLHWCTVYGCQGDMSLWKAMAPDIHEIFHCWPGSAAEAKAKKAALIAMASAGTQVQGELIHG
ncbi:DUF4123 domain-containing protein [Marinobacter sp. DY40_1A1]|uniref:DUF4123 domain-containing protein n=1 Tax=Marinobacter sp. DY40_1A1 TaxID=2583229 RepID=UPI0019082819|nr:DUF4123 domain-containing protein [Marinobacter sp. DY40_1A1]MBK1886803.1 DUF4123 domain-containing protein [Marinobacter sp. DY40_1A1]